MLGNFPKDPRAFTQVATSQICRFPRDNCASIWQAAFSPLSHQISSASAPPHCPCGASGKLSLHKLHIWEDATWEVTLWEIT